CPRIRPGRTRPAGRCRRGACPRPSAAPVRRAVHGLAAARAPGPSRPRPRRLVHRRGTAPGRPGRRGSRDLGGTAVWRRRGHRAQPAGADRCRPRRCRPAAAGRSSRGRVRRRPQGEGGAGSRLRRACAHRGRGRGVRAGARAGWPADAGGRGAPSRPRPAPGGGAGRPRQPDADPEALRAGGGRGPGAYLRRRQRQPRRRRYRIGSGAGAPALRRHGRTGDRRSDALNHCPGRSTRPMPRRRWRHGPFQPSPATACRGRCRYTAPPMASASEYEFIPPGTRFHALPSPFPMKRGGALHGARVAYETWGTLAPDAGNAVLVLTGLSPDAHAASGPHDPEPGWWEPMLGPGKPIDTSRWFVICVNALGSCKGSTGPASLDPATGDLYRLSFPELSIEDVADAAASVVRGLGIDRLACVVGNSMGGMTALGLLLRHPGIARSHVNISGSARALPFSIAVRSLQREAIRLDPNWNGGSYDHDTWPESGMRIARKLGVITYRSALE